MLPRLRCVRVVHSANNAEALTLLISSRISGHPHPRSSSPTWGATGAQAAIRTRGTRGNRISPRARGTAPGNGGRGYRQEPEGVRATCPCSTPAVHRLNKCQPPTSCGAPCTPIHEVHPVPLVSLTPQVAVVPGLPPGQCHARCPLTLQHHPSGPGGTPHRASGGDHGPAAAKPTAAKGEGEGNLGVLWVPWAHGIAGVPTKLLFRTMACITKLASGVGLQINHQQETPV